MAVIDEIYIENVTMSSRYTQINSTLTKDECIDDVTVTAQYRIAFNIDVALNVN